MAFNKVCTKKMVSDGYFDMSAYIYGRIRKNDMAFDLKKEKSEFEELYNNSYCKKENAYEFWIRKFGDHRYYEDLKTRTIFHELSITESVAIVNWVYRIMKNSEERKEFTLNLFKIIKDLHNVSNNIEETNGVFYNSNKVDIVFINSIEKFNKLTTRYGNEQKRLFYRGHSNANYLLLPSIMRNNNWSENEEKMYNDIMIECPESFLNCNSHLEKLVEMQHYGLPTRLLDITKNPLVSLYFACESNFECFGEVVLFSVNNDCIKYPQSDTVTILASLPVFNKKMKSDIKETLGEDKEIFNEKVPRLLHEIRLEKPAFLPDINPEDVEDCFVVYALKNNKRIVKQDGAFIICGLIENSRKLNEYRYKDKGKSQIMLVEEKKKILEELDKLSINKATLFPEIECVAEYIKNRYS